MFSCLGIDVFEFQIQDLLVLTVIYADHEFISIVMNTPVMTLTVIDDLALRYRLDRY